MEEVYSYVGRNLDEHTTLNYSHTEYEAEAWETGKGNSGETEHTYIGAPSGRGHSQRPSRSGNASQASFHPASQAGDFYRDTNALDSKDSNPNLRGSARAQSMAGMSQFGAGPPQLGPVNSLGGMGAMPPMSMHGMGSMPFLPYQQGYGSNPGSDYGGMLQHQMTGGMGSFGPTTSMYGAMPAPRNSVMTNFNMLGGSGSVAGGQGSLSGGLGMARPLSTFSVDPFGGTGPSPSDNPTDDELLTFLRHYLSTQDLMTVTKK